MPSVRVGVIDDHAVVREGIRRVLESKPGLTVVAEGKSGDEAIAMVQQHHPDVLVMDVAMPGRTGIQIAQELRRIDPHTRVVMLSMYDQPEYVLESMRAGARGYLFKDSPPAELRRAIRAVHSGDTYFPSNVASRLHEGQRQAERVSPLAVLTPREHDVLLGIAQGETNKQIAARLGISHRTVETHRESLMDKLGIRTVAGLTKLVLEEGLL